MPNSTHKSINTKCQQKEININDQMKKIYDNIKFIQEYTKKILLNINSYSELKNIDDIKKTFNNLLEN